MDDDLDISVAAACICHSSLESPRSQHRVPRLSESRPRIEENQERERASNRLPARPRRLPVWAHNKVQDAQQALGKRKTNSPVRIRVRVRVWVLGLGLLRWARLPLLVPVVDITETEAEARTWVPLETSFSLASSTLCLSAKSSRLELESGQNEFQLRGKSNAVQTCFFAVALLPKSVLSPEKSPASASASNTQNPARGK